MHKVKNRKTKNSIIFLILDLIYIEASLKKILIKTIFFKSVRINEKT